MTVNKRFKLNVQNDKGTYGAISENGRLMKMEKVVETLNTLYVENQQLKQELEEYRHEDECITEYMQLIGEEMLKKEE